MHWSAVMMSLPIGNFLTRARYQTRKLEEITQDAEKYELRLRTWKIMVKKENLHFCDLVIDG